MTDAIQQGALQPGAVVQPPENEVQQDSFRLWSKEEAEALRQKSPPMSPWRVVAAQAVAGLLCGAVVWVFTQRSLTAWSALYGAAVVVLPSALLARGMTRDLAGKPGAAMFGFMFWEMVKIGVAVAMLVAAPRVIQGLSWPALLVAMIVCMKVNWLALLWHRKPVVNETKKRV